MLFGNCFTLVIKLKISTKILRLRCKNYLGNSLFAKNIVLPKNWLTFEKIDAFLCCLVFRNDVQQV